MLKRILFLFIATFQLVQHIDALELVAEWNTLHLNYCLLGEESYGSLERPWAGYDHHALDAASTHLSLKIYNGNSLSIDLVRKKLGFVTDVKKLHGVFQDTRDFDYLISGNESMLKTRFFHQFSKICQQLYDETLSNQAQCCSVMILYRDVSRKVGDLLLQDPALPPSRLAAEIVPLDASSLKYDFAAADLIFYSLTYFLNLFSK